MSSPSLPLAATMAGPQPSTMSFSEEEQSLLSINSGGPSEDIGLGATEPGGAAPLDATDRGFLQALAGFGGSPDFLANGTPVVTVPTPEARKIRRPWPPGAALLIKTGGPMPCPWPPAACSRAHGGRGGGHSVCGLSRGSHSSLGNANDGCAHGPALRQVTRRAFVQSPQPKAARCWHEERDMDASRPLLGKADSVIGRETELGMLESQLAGCIEESERASCCSRRAAGHRKSRLRY